MKPKSYRNPYVSGVLLGLLLVLTIYITGDGLGASGAYKKFVIASVDAISHDYALSNDYFAPFVSSKTGVLNHFLVYEILGVIFGAILSAAIFGRLKWKIGKSPKISNKTRLTAALIGGILWGIGSQLGRGCTSGLIMSGLAVNSLSGLIGLLAVFGGGYLFAYFFRKLWL